MSDHAGGAGGKRRREFVVLLAVAAALLLAVNSQYLAPYTQALQARVVRAAYRGPGSGQQSAGSLAGSSAARGGGGGPEGAATGGGNVPAAAAADPAVRPAAAAAAAAPALPAQNLTVLIKEPAHVRGPVQKSGMLLLDHWHASSAPVRLDALTAWRKERRRITEEAEAEQAAVQQRAQRGGSSSGGAAAAPPRRYPPPPVYPACHVFVNHQYKFMYLRHPKAASTSLLAFFGKCEGGRTSHNSSCIEPLMTQRIPPAEAERMWADYLVFTFVRNPFDRAVSAYKMMMRYLEWEPVPAGEAADGVLAGGDASSPAEAEEEPGAGAAAESEAEGVQEAGSGGAAAAGGADAAGGGGGGRQEEQAAAGAEQQRYRFVLPAARQYGWDQFCIDPPSFDRLCRQDPKCTSRGRTFTMLHLLPQAPCVLAQGGGWAVDFVGAVERIDEDLDRLLDLIERRVAGEGAPPPLPRLEAQLPNVNGKLADVNGRTCVEGADTSLSSHAEPPEAYCRRESFYSGRHAACLDHIRAYYRRDVDKLFS